MIVLGYSGLDGSVAHAKRHTGLRPGEERMVQGLDSAAALIVDGKIVAAAAEERFCDEKHTNRFPVRAIEYCLGEAGVELDEVELFAHGFDYGSAAAFYRRFDAPLFEAVLDPDEQVRLFAHTLRAASAKERFRPIVHHLAHGASAYFPSGFDDALCVVCDGMGELESLTVYDVAGGEFDRVAQIPIPHSIGILYSLVTRHLGFKFNADEYKLMGLAPYGDPAAFRSFFDDLVVHRDKGHFEIHYETLTGSNRRSPHFRDVLDSLGEKIIDRPDDVDSMEQRHYDFAAAAQDVLERALAHTVRYWQQHTGRRNLCMAGGVALNCTANGKLIEEGLFEQIYIQPAAGDDGTSVGAAAYAAHVAGADLSALREPEMPFYGPKYEHDEILRTVEAHAGEFEVTVFDTLDEAVRDAAAGIRDDRVQAWFQGRMEFGPRALGNRTICANPATPDIKARVNRIIKLREGFRPFAPAVTIEHAAEYFDIDAGASPFEYMLATCQVKAQWQSRLPGITHVDGSARVQTVDRRKNPLFHQFITEIGKLTGIYCTLNTSFNVRSQPMIVSPDIAIDTFLKVEIERLYMGRIRLAKARA